MKIPTLRKKADKLYQQIGAAKYKSCLVCGGKYNCLHHFFTKGSSSALRYNLKNGIPLCISCHAKIHKCQDPSISITIKEKMGNEWYSELVRRKRIHTKTNISYYQEKITELTNLLEKLDNLA